MPTVDAGLARALFSWTLHAIVYFWLIPAYIAFYTIVPHAAGGRLYSDTMGRIAFMLLLVFRLPIGFHHLIAAPQAATAGSSSRSAHRLGLGADAADDLHDLRITGNRRAAARRPRRFRLDRRVAWDGRPCWRPA